MANAPDITDPINPIANPNDARVQLHLNDPVVVVLRWDLPYLGGLHLNPATATYGHTKAFMEKVSAEYRKFIDLLRWHLAAGHYVLIRGWYPQNKVMWERGSVESYKGALNQLIEYQGISLSLSHRLAR